MWYQIRNHLKFTSTSILSMLINNQLISQSYMDPTFIQWQDKGVKSFQDLYKDYIMNM